MALTQRQQQIYDYIVEKIESTGLPPTRAEIVAKFRFASPNAAQCHLKALEKQGVIELLGGTARGIRPVQTSQASTHLTTLPIIGRVAAGRPILAVEHQESQMSIEPTQFSPKPHFLLRVQGESMSQAGIYDGDLLVVHKTPEARSGQIVVARIDDEITVKQLQRRGRRIELVAHHPDYPIITVNKGQDFAIEGLAVGVIRAFLDGQVPLH